MLRLTFSSNDPTYEEIYGYQPVTNPSDWGPMANHASIPCMAMRSDLELQLGNQSITDKSGEEGLNLK